MKSTFAALALAGTALTATSALAAPETYMLDSSHSQVIFNYSHLGYSSTYGMSSGFEGEISFDAEDPAASSVSVSIPVKSLAAFNRNYLIASWAGFFVCDLARGFLVNARASLS